jgi:hypothetical protein
MDVNCDRTLGRRIGLEILSNSALIVHLLLKGVTLAWHLVPLILPTEKRVWRLKRLEISMK